MTIQITTLDNGLRVVTDRIDTVETAALGMWVKAGSRAESEQNNGVAHFLEHMAFKGTTFRTAADIAHSIESVGGYMNAATSRESTSYYIRLLRDDVALGMEVLSDILLNSTFAIDELERERGVILQELGMTLDTPDDLIFDYFQETAFYQQSLGRTILGPAQNIKAFQPHDLRHFMDQHYGTEQMVLAASGRVNHDEVVKWAERFFSPLQRKERTQENEKNTYVGGEKIEQKSLEQLHMVLGFKGVPLTDRPSYYALSVLTAILGGGMSSRLFQQIRERLGLVYTIYAFKACYTDAGTVGIYAGTGAEEAKKLMPVLADELHKIRDSIQETELRRAQAQLKAGLMMGLESTTNRCEHLANQMLFYGQPMPASEIVSYIDAVTAHQLTELAQQIFSSPITLVALGPTQHLCSAQDLGKQLL